MRTVGLTFHEETQSTPAVEAGASLPEAGTAAPGAGAQNPAPAPAPEKALEDMTVTELRSFAAARGIDVTSRLRLCPGSSRTRPQSNTREAYAW